MCGICGIISKNKNIDNNLLEEMNDKLKHRGPNDSGIIYDENLGLGHRRLSIIDLTSNGHQPMEYKNRYYIVFNGEIYNYLEIKNELEKKGYKFLTKTDTEVIMAAYDYYREKCLEIFNGMWAFALWDKQEQKLFCSRDRFGVKPFYFHKNEERILFASEIKSLLCDEKIKRIANEKIVYDYLKYGLLEHTNETFFKEIYKLPQGCYAIIDKNLKLEIKKYYYLNICNDVEYTKKVDKYKETFKNFFDSSIKLRLRSDVEIGCCLSGGLDSSAIVTELSNLLKNKSFETFSFCSQDVKTDEKKYVEYLANEKNIKTNYIYNKNIDINKIIKKVIFFQDEPFSSSSVIMSYQIYSAARKKGISILLDGQGADEILCGYRKSRLYFIKLLLKKKYILRAILEFFNSLTQIKTSFNIKSDFQKIMYIFGKKIEKNKDYLNKKFLQETKGVGYNTKIDFQYNDICHISLPVLLRYCDRNSMASSVESRLPFLDYRLVDFCLSLPLNLKINKGYSKYILRSSIDIPPKIKNRKDKIGFAVPEKAWIKEEASELKKIFENRNFRSSRFIDNKLILENWSKIISKNEIPHFFRYICLELWMQVFEVK